MVEEGTNNDCWSSEEEEQNFGGTMGVKGVSAIRSATFVENNQVSQATDHSWSQYITRSNGHYMKHIWGGITHEDGACYMYDMR